MVWLLQIKRLDVFHPDDALQFCHVVQSDRNNLGFFPLLCFVHPHIGWLLMNILVCTSKRNWKKIFAGDHKTSCFFNLYSNTNHCFPSLHVSTSLSSLLLPFFPPSLALSFPPSLSLPAKSASSHADLSVDRWLRAESVYLHTVPNKTSRCLQSRRSPPTTMIPKTWRRTR